jgi:hypothetical protein
MTVPIIPPGSPAAAVYALAGEFTRAAQATTTRVKLAPGRSHEVRSTPAILCTACAAELYLKAALLGAGTHVAEALESLDLEGLYGRLPAAAQSALQSSMALRPPQLLAQLRRIGSTRELWQSLGLVADGAVDAAFVGRFALAAEAVAAEMMQ